MKKNKLLPSWPGGVALLRLLSMSIRKSDGVVESGNIIHHPALPNSLRSLVTSPLLARRGFMKHEFHGLIKLILNP
jgi:hypothetical protein